MASMECLLNGTSLRVAAISEVWATKKDGTAIPVDTITDACEDKTLPWFDIRVTDYKGNTIDFNDLTYESQCQLTDYACDILL